MTSLPGRARRDVRTLVSSPLALIVALLFVAGAVTAIAAFPRERLSRVVQAAPRRRPTRR